MTTKPKSVADLLAERADGLEDLLDEDARLAMRDVFEDLFAVDPVIKVLAAEQLAERTGVKQSDELDVSELREARRQGKLGGS